MIAFTTLIRAVEPSLELTGWSVLLRNYTTPVCLILELLQRRAEGAGYRMLSRWLKRCGIDASPAACRRAALGLPPYEDAVYDALYI